MKIKIVTLSMVAAFTLGLMGCAGPMNNTERNAATGAVLGGILGGVIGHNKGRKTAEGAAIGALGGGIAGLRNIPWIDKTPLNPAQVLY